MNRKMRTLGWLVSGLMLAQSLVAPAAMAMDHAPEEIQPPVVSALDCYAMEPVIMAGGAALGAIFTGPMVPIGAGAGVIIGYGIVKMVCPDPVF